MRSPFAAARGILRAIRALGLRGVVERQLRRARDRRDYTRWVRQDRRRPPSLRRSGPVFSVLMPTHETDPVWLSRAVDSVRAQTYWRWELCIADDASSRPRVPESLEASRAPTPGSARVPPGRGHIRPPPTRRWGRPGRVRGPSRPRRRALARRPRERRGRNGPPSDADVVYSDEDKLDLRGRRVDAYFKPDFSPDLLRSQNVVSHLGVYRTELGPAPGDSRGLRGAQDHDLALRVLELSTPAEGP